MHTKQLICLGSSTGGVSALELILRDFPDNCPPTIIVQHILRDFSFKLAARLNSILAPSVVIAKEGMKILPGNIYLAEGGLRHLIVKKNVSLYCGHDDSPPVSGHRPSVDRLFFSIADLEVPAIGVLLTGMGRDGAKGLARLRSQGCRTIAQSEETCAVFGMPKAAIELGAAEFTVPVNKIGRTVMQLAGAERRGFGG